LAKARDADYREWSHAASSSGARCAATFDHELTAFTFAGIANRQFNCKFNSIIDILVFRFKMGLRQILTGPLFF